MRTRRSARLLAFCVTLATLLVAMAPVAQATPGNFSVLNTSFFNPQGLSLGPDGNFWFTVPSVSFSQVGKLTPAGDVTFFNTPQAIPEFIAAGPDGNLWFTEQGDGSTPGGIGRITPAGVITDFPIPTKFNRPYAIAAGPNNTMWFTEDGNKIGRISMSGVIKEFPIPTPQAVSDDITLGPDGNMWFTESNGGKVARISPKGVIQEFALGAASQPEGLAFDSTQTLWIVESGVNKIARYRTAATPDGLVLGAHRGFPVPTPAASPLYITPGPDGNMWFTESTPRITPGQIGRITPNGTITEFQSPISHSLPFDIITGPGGDVSYTDTFGRAVVSVATT